METAKSRILYLFLIIISPYLLKSQSLGISPNPLLHAQCPNIDVAFVISNWSSGCHSVSIENGILQSGPSIVGSNATIVVRWDNVAAEGKIIVTRSTESSCSNAANTATFVAPIKSIAGLKPTITTNPADYKIGIPLTVQCTASLNYKFRGTQDPNPMPVEIFTWTLPPGWQISSPFPDLPNITVLTTATTGGTITATGAGVPGCITISDQGVKTADRIVPGPCPMASTKEYLVCGSETPVTVIANETVLGYLDGISPISYNWSYPASWNVNGDDHLPSVIFKPDGSTSGVINVTATATAFNKTSEACPQVLTIPYEPINRMTEVVATDEPLCTDGNFSLNITPPAGSTVTWEVLPVAPTTVVPVTPASGTGSSADFALIPNSAGNCKIVFTVTNACGTSTREKTFFAGKPVLIRPTVDGRGPDAAQWDYVSVWYVCPGTHTLQIQPFGGESNCVVWTLPPNPPYYTYVNCNYVDVDMSTINIYTPCVSFTATIENDCGTSFQVFRLCPKTWGCEHYLLDINPNPASDQVQVTLVDTNNPSSTIPQMQGLQIYDGLGNLKKQIFGAGHTFTVQLDGLPTGTYFLKTIVQGQLIVKYLYVLKE
ncbi:MAG: T9SS type A sorting domain-containing protein [Saprospiraceae bacterium]|nr:T9SS type A sorting domain-containing protein [Saprospiraceae bacterium]